MNHSLSLDDILAALSGMDDATRREVTEQADEAVGGKVFIPNAGPQTAGYFSDADVLLYGGSPGGGKTALEVGLALNEHQRSLIVRKNFVDLAGVLHTLDNILGKEGSAVGGNRPLYRKPEGGIIEFAGLGDKIDSKQGNPHDLICVGKQTPVLMANGSYRPAESVRRGDMVATLEGPRRVLNAFATPPKQSVTVTANGVSQVQSASHKLLTTSGWVSHDRYGLFHPCETSSPTECQKTHTSFVLSSLKCQRFWIARALLSAGQRLRLVFGQADYQTEQEGLSACAACTELKDQGSVCEACDGTRQQSPPRPLLLALKPAQQLLRRASVGAARTLQRFAYVCGAFGGQRTSKPQDYPGRCLGGSRPCDGRTLVSLGRGIELAAGQQGLLLLADVALQTPIGLPSDDSGQVPRRIRRMWWYDHPYTMERRQSVLDVHESACSVAPFGEVELFDLEVEGANHFITLGGFINKNCVDEAAQVPEKMVRMLIGWLRTDRPGQRCRVVLGSNPPLDSTGDWLIGYFAPWLDPTYPNPAQEGELRYFLPKDGGGDRECSADERIEIHGVSVKPQSRTFISSSFTDNPYYNQEEYAKSLAGLPDAARDVLISGSFLMDRSDDIWQTIPTHWVREAQERWRQAPPAGVPMCAIGVDIAQGGADNTVLAPRHDGWFAPLIVEPGSKTPDGPTAAGLVISKRRDGATPIVDLGGGWGGDCLASLVANGIEAVGYLGVRASNARTMDRKLKFTNTRTQAYWRFREALDPSQVGGSPIALPRDPVLLADLCAPRYEITPHGIKLESKEDVKKRLGRSPDRGDAVVMSYTEGTKSANVPGGFQRLMKNHNPQVVMGHQAARRRR